VVILPNLRIMAPYYEGLFERPEKYWSEHICRPETCTLYTNRTDDHWEGSIDIPKRKPGDENCITLRFQGGNGFPNEQDVYTAALKEGFRSITPIEIYVGDIFVDYEDSQGIILDYLSNQRFTYAFLFDGQIGEQTVEGMRITIKDIVDRWDLEQMIKALSQDVEYDWEIPRIREIYTEISKKPPILLAQGK
jgi:hypothetical protein